MGCAGVSEAVTERGSQPSQWWDALPRAGWAEFTRVPNTDDWFEVYRITPRVFALYEPGQFEEVISYLIVGDNRAVLFDTGLGIGDIRAAATALTNRPITVINSHAHYDHIGGNHAFSDIRGRQTAFSRARETGAPTAEVSAYLSPAWLSRPLPEGVDRDQYRIEGYTVSAAIGDGDTLDLGGITLTALHTPGHTDDSLCLIDSANGLLFTGDTFYPAALYTHIDGAGLDAYASSLARLARTAGELTLILPGHNEPVRDTAVLDRGVAAFAAIRSGQAPDAKPDGLNEYRFEGFSVLVDPKDLARE